MNQRAYSHPYVEGYRYSTNVSAGLTQEEYRLLHPKTKVRWRFKPKSIWQLLVWGLVLFVFIKVLIWPLTEGIVNYVSKTNELNALKANYQKLDKQMLTMTKARDYMLTPAYIEEKGHEIGMVKNNEAQMVVVEATDEYNLNMLPKRKKKVEIGAQSGY